MIRAHALFHLLVFSANVSIQLFILYAHVCERWLAYHLLVFLLHKESFQHLPFCHELAYCCNHKRNFLAFGKFPLSICLLFYHIFYVITYKDGSTIYDVSQPMDQGASIFQLSHTLMGMPRKL